MACPYFEPSSVAVPASRPGVRLPLIDEYSGLCHAAQLPCEPAPAVRPIGCNQGYAHGCANHPSRIAASAMRYSITAQSPEELHIIWIEEQGYAPIRQGTIRFEIRQGKLTPAPESPVMASQLFAFCRSYLALAAPQEQQQ
jgi:hypothetical protein